MSPGILYADMLRHPCDTAFGILLAPRDAGTTLYIYDTGAEQVGQGDTRARLRAVLSKAHGSEHDGRGANEAIIRDFDALELALGEGECSLVVLVAANALTCPHSVLAILLKRIRRVLRPDGELLIASGRAKDQSAADSRQPQALSVKRSKLERLMHQARTVLAALDRRHRSRLDEALRIAGFAHSEWFIPQRSSSECLTQIHALAPSIQFARHPPLPLREWLRIISSKEVIVRTSTGTLQPSILMRSLKEAGAALGSNLDRTRAPDVRSILVSAKEKVVVMAGIGDSEVVLRFPLSAQAQAGCKQNMVTLRNLCRVSSLASFTPYPIYEGTQHGQYFGVESRVSGTPIRQLAQGDSELRTVEALLRTLNPADRIERQRLTSSLFEDLITKPLAAILPLVQADTDRSLVRRFFHDSFHDRCVVVGLSHGDFSISNIFLENGQVSGLIDWDEGSVRGLPILDAISHVFSRQGYRGKGFADTLRRIATQEEWPSRSEPAFLARCYRYFHVKPQDHFSMILLYWLHVVGNQAHYWFAHDDAFVHSHIDEAVRLIAKR